MTNPNETLFNGQVRRRIAIERYSDAQSKKTLAFLEELRADIVKKIEAAGSPGAYSVRQQRELLKSVDRLHQDIYAKVYKVLDSDFDRMARDQAKFEAKELRSVVNVSVREISATQAYEVAKARPMQGEFLENWLKKLEPTHRARLDAALRLSYIEGETQAQAMRRIRETINISGNGLKALIRTSNSHISSAVTLATYEENPDLVGEYEWRSTLDSRTTPICQTRDGERYPVGKGPIPPAHVSCRSTTTPILKDFPPPKRVTYNEWLKGQPKDVQDEILGKKRGAAFRDGAKVKDFVSPTGKVKPAPPPLPPPPEPIHPDSMTEEQFDRMRTNSMDYAPDWAKQAMDLRGASVARGTTGGRDDGFYLPLKHQIFMGKDFSNPRSIFAKTGEGTMRHEQGHAIDFGRFGSRPQQLSNALTKEAAEDAQALRMRDAYINRGKDPLTDDQTKAINKSFDRVDLPDDNIMELIERAMVTGSPNDLEIVVQYIRRRKETAYSESGWDWMMFADITEALTKGKYGFGHGDAYYARFTQITDGYTNGHMTEAFANVYALLSGPRGEAWQVILDRFYPNFTAGVVRLIKEDIKNG